MSVGVVKFLPHLAQIRRESLKTAPVIALRKRGLLQFFDHFINRFIADFFLAWDTFPIHPLSLENSVIK